MSISMVILISFLMLVIGVLSYACFNLIKKLEIYENWVDTFKEESESLYQKLKAVDDRNLFEKDDDVGFVFSEIVKLIELIKEKSKWKNQAKKSRF